MALYSYGVYSYGPECHGPIAVAYNAVAYIRPDGDKQDKRLYSCGPVWYIVLALYSCGPI